MTGLWNRALWMRLGAAQAFCAAAIFILTDPAPALRLATQIQFMHGMATIACCTFMSVGAKGASRAPALFQSGIMAYCLPVWLGTAGVVLWPGALLLALGWLTMIWAGKQIDTP